MEVGKIEKLNDDLPEDAATKLLKGAVRRAENMTVPEYEALWNEQELSRLRSELEGWKDRFKALVGEDSPDIAGNRVIDLRDENKNLCEQVDRCNKAMLKLEADNAEAKKLLTALAASGDAATIFSGDLMAHIRTFLAEHREKP